MKKILHWEKLNVLAKKISSFTICAGAATFICLTVRLILIYISNCKFYRGLREAAYIVNFKKDRTMSYEQL